MDKLRKQLVAFILFVPALATGAQISGIEINQAIGVQKNDARKFVAGKNTVVRALLAAPEAIDPARTSAKIIRNGATVTTLEPAGDRRSGDGAEGGLMAPPERKRERRADGVYEVTIGIINERKLPIASAAAELVEQTLARGWTKSSRVAERTTRAICCASLPSRLPTASPEHDFCLLSRRTRVQHNPGLCDHIDVGVGQGLDVYCGRANNARTSANDPGGKHSSDLHCDVFDKKDHKD